MVAGQLIWVKNGSIASLLNCCEQFSNSTMRHSPGPQAAQRFRANAQKGCNMPLGNQLERFRETLDEVAVFLQSGV